LTERSPNPIPYPEGSLGGEFQLALAATTLSKARARWQRLLDRHAPRDGEYEDGFQVNHVQVARIELARVHYLLGEPERGDALLEAMLADR
jgi:hypothetical protein